MQDLGLEVKLANPSKVKIIAESQIKTDKVDALALAQLLRTNFLPESYLAPKEQREARDLLRYWVARHRTKLCGFFPNSPLYMGMVVWVEKTTKR